MAIDARMFSAANRGRSINFINNSLSSARNHSLKVSSIAKQRVEVVQDEPPFSFSIEAIKMLEDKKEIEKQEKAQKMIDDLKAQSANLKETEKTSKQKYLYERIGEIKKLLKMLLEIMRSAFILGNKHAAVLIAKEAAKLAKELAGLIKSAGTGDVGEKISVPDVNFSNESAGSGDNLESGENTDAESINSEAANAANIEAANAEPPEEAAQAEEAQEEAQNDADTVKALDLAESAKKIADEATGKTNESVSKAETKKSNSGQRKGSRENLIKDLREDLIEIVAYLKSIMSMAKATLKQKANKFNRLSTISADPLIESRLQKKLNKELDKAEDDIEDAIAVIQDSILESDLAEAMGVSEGDIAEAMGAIEGGAAEGNIAEAIAVIGANPLAG